MRTLGNGSKAISRGSTPPPLHSAPQEEPQAPSEGGGYRCYTAPLDAAIARCSPAEVHLGQQILPLLVLPFLLKVRLLLGGQEVLVGEVVQVHVAGQDEPEHEEVESRVGG